MKKEKREREGGGDMQAGMRAEKIQIGKKKTKQIFLINFNKAYLKARY